ncbi:uncharacterized protein I206_103893 [Kwoniella pini CBS 10737]|uniref:Mediator of RNA polymerase II transcription subunit 10 n=1 Tax=Kwoniella pini CBS 10737 TaxID=1296096 RepID=A0A1B9I389_9TREE|nr:uncharacterized protein I206_04534 [Kwoniella pini CBS 10737]OCF50003.1 hypothetical protein I206_04534 [Kwoniella pini CBS 10737]
MSLGAPQLPSPAPTPGSGLGMVSQPSPDGPPDQSALRTELESQLLRLTQDLYELEICAGDVGPGMEDAVPKYLMKVNQGFINLERIAGQLGDSVPHQIVDNIDRYKNPHVFTKNTLTRAVGENQYALGRVLGLESFRRQLHDALKDEFPDVPLPGRRHEPDIPAIVQNDNETLSDGYSRSTQVNGDVDVKVEEDNGLPDGNAKSGPQ